MYMKNTLVFILLSYVSIVIAQNNQNVVYGERNKYFQSSEDTYRLFFDENGDLYPNTFIADQVLIENSATLQGFYSNNSAEFVKASKELSLDFETFTETNFKTFQESIIHNQLLKLNNEIAESSHLYILIHGFRKPISPRNGGTSSQDDNNSLKKVILSQYEVGADVKFIEIYWDGMYDCCAGFKRKTNKRILRLYENQAQNNAVRTGYSLRRVVSKIDQSNFTIITHSLGAQVGISLLMNAYDDQIDTLKQHWATPAQSQIDICLIAPATSKEPFEAYYERTTTLDFKKNDNYNLSILYNEEDIVLRKKVLFFGPGARKYGNTSLGCNYRHEIDKLKTLVSNEFGGAHIDYIHAAIGKPHSLRYYANSSYFRSYIKS